MVSNYVRSPEGIAEYKKIGLEYPNEFSDNQYDEYLNQTRKSPKDKTLVEIRNDDTRDTFRRLSIHRS